MTKPALGERLYELLPAVYRSRDNGDLQNFLAACGELLDQIHQTLAQRLADGVPEPSDGRAAQEWLLPYIADLLDVRLVSPDVRGRRAEVGHAVAWRQRKGTPATVEAIAEAVGRLEVEVHEGWQRVAVTPRIGMPLMPARALGYAHEPFAEVPGLAARHPGLPAVTVDVRCPSRAVQTEPKNPAARTTRFGSAVHTWRQASAHGAPCFPGSYEDRSRRTVDTRTPSWQEGHHHPRRLLLYAPPAAGFFDTAAAPVALRPEGWDTGATVDYRPCTGGRPGYCMTFPLAAPAAHHVKAVTAQRRGLLLIERAGQTHGIPVVVTQVIRQAAGIALHLQGPPPPEGLGFPVAAEKVTLSVAEAVTVDWSDRDQPRYAGLLGTARQGGVRVLSNLTAGTPWSMSVRIRGVVELDAVSSAGQTLGFEGLCFDNTVIAHRSRVHMIECAARKIEVHTIDTDEPVIEARDCLLGAVQAARGLSRLEYCTVLGTTLSETLEASECIFVGVLKRHHHSLLPPARGCVRYSRMEPGQDTGSLSIVRCTRDPVVFWSATYGQPSCGVLHPATPGSVRAGAEDGGELGAYHGRYYCLATEAVIDKLREHIPLGVEAVVIPDPRLVVAPPA